MDTTYMVTGVTGFIGKELVKRLDGKVYGIARWSSKRIEPEGYELVFADLGNYNEISNTIRKVKPEIVINLGAMTPVSLSFERPFEYVDSNFIGVMNLVEANRKFNPYLKKFIQASSPETYGMSDGPLTPDSELMPNSPYAVTKAAADMYLAYAFRSFGFPVVTSRHANSYGRKDMNHFVIERIVTQMIENPAEIFLGEKEPRRDFMYIDDVVDFYIKLVEKGVPGNVYTAGWNSSISIGEIVEMSKRVTGWDGKINWGSIPKRPGEIKDMRLDASKSNKELGWYPKVPIEEGLRRVYEHWKNKS